MRASSRRSSFPRYRRTCKVNQLIAVIAAEGEDVKAAAGGAGAKPPLQGRGSGARAEGCRSAPAGSTAAKTEPLPPAPASIAQAASRAPHSSPRRWRGASPASSGIDSPRSFPAPARMAASSSGTSRRPSSAEPAKAAPAAAAPGAAAPKRRAVKACPTIGQEALRAGLLTEVPHDNMRKTIARRLTEAKIDHPAFLPDHRLRTRRAAGAARADQQGGAQSDGKPAYKLSVNDIVIKALALRCATCRTPTSPGPTAPCSSTSTPTSASPCRSPAA
jgi:pyruvate dehydrogenase E2 component (dihydrolipoamide acetyltransferase)